MTKLSLQLTHIKSPTLTVGLFCLVLLSGCNRADNPDDVTISFWTALAENDLEQAASYSTEGSARLFNEKLRNASLQIGKIKYDCDGATVETHISLQSAAVSSSFKTFLIRDQQEDLWKVDYPRTLSEIDKISDKRFNNIISATQKTGQAVTEKVKFDGFFKELWHAVVTVFENLKNRLSS